MRGRNGLARAIGALSLACATTALAAPPGWPEAISGRLRQIRETGVVRLGYRENAIPFSYLARGQPAGYSLDICQAIVATIAEDMGSAPPRTEYVAVTAQDRIAKVLSGGVDLECGATTNTAERRKQVAFSPVIFITGTRIAVRRGSKVHDADDLRNRRVAVVRGTTNEAAMREVDRLRALGLAFVAADDYREALALLADGKADALAADEILLRGLLAETNRHDDFALVGPMLSYEPYGIMYARDDPGMSDVVERTLRALAESREIAWLYERWFVRPLPGGSALALPMGQELRRSFELLGLPAE
jgi:glutamate/aspartate transport system substrate-binding protein